MNYEIMGRSLNDIMNGIINIMLLWMSKEQTIEVFQEIIEKIKTELTDERSENDE